MIVEDLAVSDPAVSAVLATDKRVGVFASPPWFEVLSETYGLGIRASVLRDGDTIKGLVPYCHVRDIRGERIVSVPFSDFCDPLADSLDDWRAMVAPLVATGVPSIFRLVHNTVPLSDARFRVADTHLWMATDIAGTPDDMFEAVSRNARESVIRSRKRGVTTRVTTSAADVTTYWKMQIAIRKSKHRLLAQPEAFFQNLRDRFDAEGRFMLVLAEGCGGVVSGSVFLEWGDTLFYKYNASVANAFGANDLVLWQAISYAAEKGLKLVDFGLSEAEHEGLIRFKRKWTSQERPLHWLRSNDAKPLPANTQGAAVGAVLGDLTELLTRDNVPNEISADVGALLYRFFA
jgi:CelD/BcsL family acetyltransferase involved in cellulose biosynthesis